MTRPRGDRTARHSTLLAHGARIVAGLHVDSYNVELGDDDGFIGDKANKLAFRDILQHLRHVLRESGEKDPLGEKDSHEIGRKKLDALLAKGDARAAAVVQGAIEEYAQELAAVIKRFMRLKAWHDTEAIVIGGGFRAGRVGELAIARTGILLKTEIGEISVRPIHNDPDDAGLLGTAWLIPSWMLDGYDAMVGVDVGGTKLRAGLIELNLMKARDLSKACVCARRQWRHADEDGVTRGGAVRYLTKAINALIKDARSSSLRLAPAIGVGCPGLIEEDGTIARGAQNLPGAWAGSRFHLPALIRKEVADIGGHEPVVVMHNDAVVQGLSELPHLARVDRWGILTIGTGLGNARFSREQRKGRKG